MEVQKEENSTVEGAQGIINCLHDLKHLNLFHRRGLHLDAFFRFLFGDSNPLLFPSIEMNFVTEALELEDTVKNYERRHATRCPFQDIISLRRLFRFLQRLLAQLLSVVRAPKSKEGYAAIGGGSPLRKITGDQSIALRKTLEAKEIPVNVYVAMQYWHPFTEEAV